MDLEISRQILEKKNTQISNFKEIRPVGTEFFHADGRTDGQTDMELTVALRTFAKSPIKY